MALDSVLLGQFDSTATLTPSGIIPISGRIGTRSDSGCPSLCSATSLPPQWTARHNREKAVRISGIGRWELHDDRYSINGPRSSAVSRNLQRTTGRRCYGTTRQYCLSLSVSNPSAVIGRSRRSRRISLNSHINLSPVIIPSPRSGKTRTGHHRSRRIPVRACRRDSWPDNAP